MNDGLFLFSADLASAAVPQTAISSLPTEVSILEGLRVGKASTCCKVLPSRDWTRLCTLCLTIPGHTFSASIFKIVIFFVSYLLIIFICVYSFHPQLASGEIAPFSLVQLEVIFNPAKPGNALAEFEISFSDPLSPPVSINCARVVVSLTPSHWMLNIDDQILELKAWVRLFYWTKFSRSLNPSGFTVNLCWKDIMCLL